MLGEASPLTYQNKMLSLTSSRTYGTKCDVHFLPNRAINMIALLGENCEKNKLSNLQKVYFAKFMRTVSASFKVCQRVVKMFHWKKFEMDNAENNKEEDSIQWRSRHIKGSNFWHEIQILPPNSNARSQFKFKTYSKHIWP